MRLSIFRRAGPSGIGLRAALLAVASLAMMDAARANVVSASDVKSLADVGTDFVKLYETVNQQAASAHVPCVDSLASELQPVNFMTNDLYDLYYAAYSAQDSSDEDTALKMITHRTPLYRDYLRSATQQRAQEDVACATTPGVAEHARQFRDLADKLITVIDAISSEIARAAD